jgi:invasion protein IalB
MRAAAALRSLPLVVALLAAPAGVGALAQQQGSAPRPSRLGEHGSWTAATHTENGQKVCYAFARPTRSEPDRQDVMLTVTHRPGQRDAVVLSPGYAYPRGAEVKVSVGGRTLDFYTAGAAAAPLDAAAALRAFRGGREAVARGPGPNGRGTATDAFPLAGFGAALDAINRECPAQAGRLRR